MSKNIFKVILSLLILGPIGFFAYFKLYQLPYKASTAIKITPKLCFSFPRTCEFKAETQELIEIKCANEEVEEFRKVDKLEDDLVLDIEILNIKTFYSEKGKSFYYDFGENQLFRHTGADKRYPKVVRGLVSECGFWSNLNIVQ